MQPSAPGVRKRLAFKNHFPKPCQFVSLWVDSTDFRTTGMRTMRRKDPRWSQKLRSPGRRWLTLTDAAGCVQFVAGPYNPTDYDGHIMIDNREQIERLFDGESIIGDNHFRIAGNFFKKCPIVAPKSEGRASQEREGPKSQVFTEQGRPGAKCCHCLCARACGEPLRVGKTNLRNTVPHVWREPRGPRLCGQNCLGLS